MKLPALFTRLRREKALGSVPGSGGWFRILESFGGAWQAHVVAETMPNLLTFSAVYSCVALISGDIAKLNLRLVQDAPGGIRQEVDAQSPFKAVLKKPNHYQTRIQFIRGWIISKLLHGNAYLLKERDQRGVVVQLYLLDPQRVTPLVAASGDIFYQVAADNLSGVPLEVTVPASEIIHDRGATLYHPLVGVSPIVACAYSGTQGLTIQRNSATFFKNMSRPSGMLTAPGKIGDETAARLKRQFEENFSGSNVGRIAVGGDGLEFKLMTIPAEASQLIDQLKWTVEDVARCFQVPLHMIGAASGQTGQNYGVLSQAYYSQTLQLHIEEIELLLDEGLKLPPQMGSEFDLDGLLRMDTSARFEAHVKAILGGWMTPNEARAREGLAPVTGGETPYLQHQNYSLAALAKRDAKDDPFATETPQAPGAPAAPEKPPAGEEISEREARETGNYIEKELECV